MERAISVEEKIRRAEEIYERRRQGETRPVAKVSVNEKKDIKLLKKMIIQILVCVAIYLIIYTIQNNQYVFSQNFINKVNEILSYDTNFAQLYQDAKNMIKPLLENEENVAPEDSIGGAEENSSEGTNEDNGTEEGAQRSSEEENGEGQVNSESQDGQDTSQDVNNEANVENLSQEEQDIINIKNTASFIKPVEGIVSSKFGQRDTATGGVPKNHTGTDIAANTGTKIISATDGEVVLASEEGDYGKHLKIQIGEVSIIYAHCNSLYVKQGDKVTQGQEIAEVGSTGNSTGPHLHFEIRISERVVDPEKILEL